MLKQSPQLKLWQYWIELKLELVPELEQRMERPLELELDQRGLKLEQRLELHIELELVQEVQELIQGLELQLKLKPSLCSLGTMQCTVLLRALCPRGP